MGRNAETREERRYRLQRRAIRDGLRDYRTSLLVEKLVSTVGGWLLGILLLYAYISWDMSKMPAKHAKFVKKQAEKTMLFNKLEKCKKTGNPKRKECTDIWWKWIRMK